MAVAIKISNLTKKFGDLVAVDNISFDIEQGEIFGLLGPNGAGKTTMLSMLSTMLRPIFRFSNDQWHRYRTG